jgi:hypothetical protein
MVDGDTCGFADDDCERIAERTCCGKLSGNGMATIHHSECYASRQGANHYDGHVRIKSAIRMLMEFNISGNRKPGHRASKADPVHDPSTGCECSEYENDQRK